MSVPPITRSWVWLALCVVAGAGLFALAVSNAAYEATSPFWLTWHVLLRKSYSVVAFALIGFLLARATLAMGRPWSTLSVSIAIGAYSALIELCQRLLSGARESLEQQAFDVAMGLLGGALGALVAAQTWRRAPRA